MTIGSALEEAAWVYSRIGNYDKQQKFDAVASLAEWGVFSLRHVAAITGLSHTTVRRIAWSKSDKTGGTFHPDCLVPLLEIRKRYLRGEQVTADEVRDMLNAGSGTSIYFAARLGGLKESWVRSKSKERSRRERSADATARVAVADEPGA